MKTIAENPLLRYLMIALVSISLLMVTGCSGCQDKNAKKTAAEKKKEEEEKKKKKKRKVDFETRKAVILPGYFPKPKTEKQKEEEKKNPLLAAMAEINRPSASKNKAKLGHWVTTNFQAIANNFNVDGQLTTFSQPLGASNRAVEIPGTNYYQSSSRPVSLPKGEWKNFESTVFLPTRKQDVKAASVNYQIGRSSGGLSQIQVVDGAPLMKPFQYHMLLMSTQPDKYAYLEFADAIRLRGSDVTGNNLPEFYLVVPTIPGDPLPLPRHALNWTTIAYMVWDDFDPNELEPDHQQALLDWIHFGGQVIVSGPDSLDKLQSSFLADYLPAHFEQTRNLTNADVKELNDNWTVEARKKIAQKRTLNISEDVPLLGVDFKPHDDADFVTGTGDMVIERRLGRGRIVVTAFSLNSPTIRKWRSFKSFLNGALLRKPSRNFGTVVNDLETVVFEWANDGASIYDPMLGSTLRFLARDLSVSGTPNAAAAGRKVLDPDFDPSFNPGFAYNDVDDDDHIEYRLQHSRNGVSGRNLENNWHYGGYADAEQSGTSGWNDASGIAIAARDTLKEAAGISPPSSTFVLKMLAAYLAVLVPLNWFVFWMIGKVEYAWVAAPIIAIAGAFLVVKFAALDIGFVRSNTQVGLLEVQSDYSRAHLAEYSALYTSLSTSYSAELDNLTSQAIPFSITDNPHTYVREEGPLSQVRMKRTIKNSLEGFQIQSNSTGLVHAESLIDLNGVFSFVPPTDGEASVGNSTTVSVQNGGVVGRAMNGEYQFAWVGDLEAGGSADLKFENVKSFKSLNRGWLKIPSFQSTSRTSAQIWKKNVQDAKSATMSQILTFPELESNLEEFERLMLRSATDANDADRDVFTQKQFDRLYQRVYVNPDVSIGRMFDKVIRNLTLAPGEYRLIGSSAEKIGKTSFVPVSTQVDQTTLVVVHLKRPKLPVAEKDRNALEDFATRSSLDWEDEAMKREKLRERLEEERN